MSTFYVLPPRSLVGEYFAGFLGTLFPGLNWTQEHWIELANLLGTTASQHPEVYVLHREDLPDGEDLTRALVDGFGAEVGDQIIEVRPGTKPGDLVTQFLVPERCAAPFHKGSAVCGLTQSEEEIAEDREPSGTLISSVPGGSAQLSSTCT